MTRYGRGHVENSLPLTPDRAIALRREADRVLADPVFRRSPIQSKLLRFLVETSVRGGPPPSQFEIAVDALGKTDDFDMVNDSYPRVQMSRLRTNIDHYYARSQPGAAGRLMLRPGKYHITLEQVPQPPAASGEANSNAALAPAATPAPAPAPEPDRRWLAGLSSPAAALILAGIIALALAVLLGQTALERDGPTTGVPQLVIQPAIGGLEAGDAEGRELAKGVLEAAELQLAHSLFTRTPPVGRSAPDAEYRARIGFARRTASNRLSATVVLTHRDGEQLYFGQIEHDPDAPRALIAGIEVAMIQLISPQGAIARREVARIGEEPRSAFECFILIENGQGDGRTARPLTDRCLADYPDSEFTPYWHARRAYEAYQADILAGRPLAKAGQPWDDLRRSLDRSPFNPFANFVLAKLELAQGDCAAAAPFMERTFLAGSGYPALVTALEAEAAPCVAPGQRVRDRAETQALFDRHPHPNPMFQNYLMLSSLAHGQPEEARRIAARTLVRPSDGPEAQVAALLQRAARDPAFAQANGPLLAKALSPFVWNPRSAQAMILALQRAEPEVAIPAA